MINRTQARRVTIGAQLASLLLVGGAVAVMALGLPLGEPPTFTAVEVSLPEAGGPEPSLTPEDTLPASASVDFVGIVERLKMVGNAPSVDEPAQAGGPEGGASPITPTTQDGDEELRYLGMIEIGARRSAMLVIDGKQRIVSQGGSVSDASGGEVRVLSIQPGFVMLNRDGARQRVEKGERQASAVTTIERTAESARRENERRRSETAAPTNVVTSENPRADFERRRREAIDRALEEGRITQEEAQRMLDRMNNAANRRGRDD